jgi:hypothetical protein
MTRTKVNPTKKTPKPAKKTSGKDVTFQTKLQCVCTSLSTSIGIIRRHHLHGYVICCMSSIEDENVVVACLAYVPRFAPEITSDVCYLFRKVFDAVVGELFSILINFDNVDIVVVVIIVVCC